MFENLKIRSNVKTFICFITFILRFIIYIYIVETISFSFPFANITENQSNKENSDQKFQIMAVFNSISKVVID